MLTKKTKLFSRGGTLHQMIKFGLCPWQKSSNFNVKRLCRRLFLLTSCLIRFTSMKRQIENNSILKKSTNGQLIFENVLLRQLFSQWYPGNKDFAECSWLRVEFVSFSSNKSKDFGDKLIYVSVKVQRFKSRKNNLRRTDLPYMDLFIYFKLLLVRYHTAWGSVVILTPIPGWSV